MDIFLYGFIISLLGSSLCRFFYLFTLLPSVFLGAISFAEADALLEAELQGRGLFALFVDLFKMASHLSLEFYIYFNLLEKLDWPLRAIIVGYLYKLGL